MTKFSQFVPNAIHGEDSLPLDVDTVNTSNVLPPLTLQRKPFVLWGLRCCQTFP